MNMQQLYYKLKLKFENITITESLQNSIKPKPKEINPKVVAQPVREEQQD